MDATHNVIIKCTQCNFLAKATTNKRTSRISKEMFNICHTSQNARLRAPPMHKSCLRKCKICKLKWSSKTILNPDGTSYRLLPFDCNLSHVVYIIHCTLCGINYIACIRNWRNTSVARHFREAGHDVDKHFKVALIDHAFNGVLDTRVAHSIYRHQ